MGLSIGPAGPAERIASIDAVRGIALLGILVANVRQMFLPWDVATFPVPGAQGELLGQLDWALFDAVVDLKFITLFSLLFGMGFALQSGRSAVARPDFPAIYLRRIAMLAVFGALHALLLYPADVLLPYAIAGMCLYATRGLSTRNLYRIGIVLVATTVVWGFQFGSLGRVSPGVTGIAMAAFAVVVALLWDRNWRAALVVVALVMAIAIAVLLLRGDPRGWGLSVAGEYSQALSDLAAMRSADAGAWPEEYAARRNGGFRALLQLHAQQHWLVLAWFGVVLLWRTLGLNMIGAALVRSGAIAGATPRTWRRVSIVGLGIGLPMSVLATFLQSREMHGVSDWRWPEWLHVASAFPLAIGFGARVMLNEHLRKRRWWYAPMESAGRMALSNYVGQSLVLAAIAEPWGFALYGRLSGPELTSLACVVFAVLALASHAWLTRYRMGPLEWLWRCGTYWTWLPLRR